jgi:DNA-binding transcriptional ArsR family regulator
MAIFAIDNMFTHKINSLCHIRGRAVAVEAKAKEVEYGMEDHISSTFAALADPTRRAILARLALGETSVTDLAAPFEMSMPAVSRHLKVLEKAGLIARGREAQWRPCKLKPEPLKQAADWLDEYRRFWEESFDRLDEYLKALQAKEKKHAGKKK